MINGVRVRWDPSTDPQTDHYEVQRAETPSSAFTMVALVPHQIPGPDYDGVLRKFKYDDYDGTVDMYYRVIGATAQGLAVSDSAIFQVGGAQGAGLDTRLKVDHNYGGVDLLRYTTAGGTPIPNAQIKIFRQVDYSVGRNDLAIASSETDPDGRWVVPVFLEPGMNYVVYFFKSGLYGPDITIITV